ncbi:MAG TPA: hypothetical protein RMG45_01790, partial [Polyangiaceae bacterium LLY-WYZ-15_(1-7)]|nr:hypothetical protein [Polyangiaceae bacterium LLY-WYZ-15_(1-7)]
MRVAPLAVLARLRGWSRDPRITAALALGCLALAGVLLAVALRTGPATLRISGGQSLGLRHTLAEQLAAGAGEHELVLEVIETEGSTEALAAVQAGELDAAL